MVSRPGRKADRMICFSELNSNLQRELVGDMEMMSHFGNSKYREACTETKFKKKKILCLRKDNYDLMTLRL